MDIGWKKINDYWYFFNTDGSMQTGWKKIDGKWYYFNPDGGTMNTNTFTEDYRKYVFYSTGALRQTEIKINEEKQKKSHWCWAASSVMVGTYYTDSTITQENVLVHIKGSTLNFFGYPTDYIRAIRYASKKTKSATETESLSFEKFVEEIDNNRPIIIRLVRLDNEGGHSVVCAGYDLEGKRLLIVDPWEDNDTLYYKYSDIENGTSFYGVNAKRNTLITFTYN